MPPNEEAFISRVSIRHSVSPDAVRTVLGGGTMAQFSHSSPGMTMAISLPEGHGRRL
jgi:hypothetical protein